MESGKFQQQVILVDSPNTFYETNEEYGAFHIYAFICPLTRYTADRQLFLEEVINVFGNSFFDRCILIFTHCSKEQEECIEEEIKAVSEMDKNILNLSPEKNYLLCPKDSHDVTSCEQFKTNFAKRVIAIAAHSLKTLSLKSSKTVEHQHKCEDDIDNDFTEQTTTVPKCERKKSNDTCTSKRLKHLFSKKKNHDDIKDDPEEIEMSL